jgi:hypothetical protein
MNIDPKIPFMSQPEEVRDKFRDYIIEGNCIEDLADLYLILVFNYPNLVEELSKEIDIVDKAIQEDEEGS